MKKETKKHGEKAIEASCNKFLQTCNANAFASACTNGLNNKDKVKALQLLLHTEERRDGRVKGRNCADGRKQHLWQEK